MSAKEKQVLKITRGAFLEVLGDHAVKKIKEKNPRKEIYTESITWLKKQWEEIWKLTDNKIDELVNLFGLNKDPNMSLKDHWDKVQEATAKCKLEEVEANNLDKVMAVAAFTHSMRKSHLIAQIWEKNKTHAELEIFIDGQTKAEEMRKKVQHLGKDEGKSQVTVKTEPVAAITRKRKFSKSGKNKKAIEKKCRRCGEKYYDGHNSERKANGKTCNECKKVGHLASCCFKRKNAERNKVSRVEEKYSESENEEETSSSDTSIFLIRPVNKVEQQQKNHARYPHKRP